MAGEATAAFDAALQTAVKSAKDDLGVTPENPVGAGDKVEQTPEAEPAKKADDKPDVKGTEDADLDLTAEDLEAIEADPKLKKSYKSMLRDYRRKTTELADQRKEHAERLRLLDLMAQDPDGVVKALAAARGIKLAEVDPKPAEVRDEIGGAFAELEKALGKDTAAVLRPVFEATVNTVLKKALDERVAPLEQKALEFSRSALAQSIEAGTAAFKAKVTEDGGEWDDDLEKEMAIMVSKVTPSEDVTFEEYMDTIYHAVTSKRNKTESTRDKIARLKAAAAAKEPGNPVRPATPANAGGIGKDTPLPDAISLAVQMAKKELGRS